MAEPNAQSLAMAIEIRRKNKRKTIPTPASDTVHESEEAPMDEFDVADSSTEATLSPEPVSTSSEAVQQTAPINTDHALNIARAIMKKHKAPTTVEDSLDLDDEPKVVKSSNDRIAAILGRKK